MTSYSVLTAAGKHTVLATWPSQFEESYSTKITTLTTEQSADDIANILTVMSETLWEAACWHDTSAVLERDIDELITALRGAEPITPVDIDTTGLRNTNLMTFTDYTRLRNHEAPDALNGLTRAQRLTVADELAADADARADALATVRAGADPTGKRSRAWQICQIGRATRTGLTGWLPEGGPMWLVETWGEFRDPAERWAARCHLIRIDQLQAACDAVGGRGLPQRDPLLGHLVLPREVLAEPIRVAADAEAAADHPGRTINDFVVLYLGRADDADSPYKRDPFAPMTVLRPAAGRTRELARLDLGDDDGFAAALGEWTRKVPYRP